MANWPVVDEHKLKPTQQEGAAMAAEIKQTLKALRTKLTRLGECL
jgi:hypothetical protein